MKKLYFLPYLILFLSISPAVADEMDGKAIFFQNKCNTCHYPDTVSIGPTLKKIAESYDGKKEQLIRFLNGEETPIVFPDRFKSIMEAFLGNTKILKPEERQKLADFILGHN